MSRVLQVDISGRPLGLISWQRAVNMIYQGNAVALEVEDGKYWRSPSLAIPVALIIQTEDYVKLRPLKDNHIIKRVLFARDNYKCQYCFKDVTLSTGTTDHVKPKSKFVASGRPASDAHTWDNVVLACEKCNLKKDNRLPMECGMHLKKAPRKPDYVQVLWAGKIYHSIHAK